MTLGSEIINLIRFYFADDCDKSAGVGKIAVMQMKVRMSFQMDNALAHIHTGTTDDAMYVISFFKQEFRQIRTILTGNACN